ncbi:hypothetical protein AMEX_G3978 [Astyanax mexicanus]|uniref:Uncharacterized protein n=1 Tax=Astyanax mexicanus TaxID=7994 RepID=A0A8T2MC62_ASTMX|nr:hypothetical protein AMEX_G3978 [Astyanax mexicanus]
MSIPSLRVSPCASGDQQQFFPTVSSPQDVNTAASGFFGQSSHSLAVPTLLYVKQNSMEGPIELKDSSEEVDDILKPTVDLCGYISVFH